MGYSRSTAAIARVRPLLDQMVATKANLVWPTEDGHMLAYHIREAMTIAKRRSIAPYHELKDKFIIRNRGSRVVAELREINIIAALHQSMSRVVITELATVTELVGALITNKAATEIFFEDTVLVYDELVKLNLWCKANQYFIVVSESGVTVTKNDPGEARWQPVSTS